MQAELKVQGKQEQNWETAKTCMQLIEQFRQALIAEISREIARDLVQITKVIDACRESDQSKEWCLFVLSELLHSEIQHIKTIAIPLGVSIAIEKFKKTLYTTQ